MEVTVQNPLSTYKVYLKEIAEKIESGPFKLTYICEKLGISRVTLYKKRKNNSFTLKEVEILTDLFEKV